MIFGHDYTSGFLNFLLRKNECTQIWKYKRFAYIFKIFGNCTSHILRYLEYIDYLF